jgi:actin-related protein
VAISKTTQVPADSDESADTRKSDNVNSSADGDEKQTDETKASVKPPRSRFLVGHQMDTLDEELEYHSPVTRNMVKNWDEMEAVWYGLQVLALAYTQSTTRNYVLARLGVKQMHNESPVMLLVPVEWSKNDAEIATQILFESFNVPGMFILEKPLAVVYGVGIMSGLVIDIGYETTCKFRGCLSRVAYKTTQQRLRQ